MLAKDSVLYLAQGKSSFATESGTIAFLMFCPNSAAFLVLQCNFRTTINFCMKEKNVLNTFEAEIFVNLSC